MTLGSALLLAGCNIHNEPDTSMVPSDTSDSVILDGKLGLSFPTKINQFSRVDVLRRGPSSNDVTVGYAQVNPSPITATVRVHPASANGSLLSFGGRASIADAKSSAQELLDSIAQVRHFYPNATILSQRNAYLVNGGAMQTGVEAILQYEFLVGGQKQTVNLDIYTFCCVAGRWAYEYRFRYPAGTKDDFDITRFMQALPWTPPSDSSPAPPA